eukprot:6090507-Pyramimonas_sp.AAC.1
MPPLEYIAKAPRYLLDRCHRLDPIIVVDLTRVCRVLTPEGEVGTGKATRPEAFETEPLKASFYKRTFREVSRGFEKRRHLIGSR